MDFEYPLSMYHVHCTEHFKATKSKVNSNWSEFVSINPESRVMGTTTTTMLMMAHRLNSISVESFLSSICPFYSCPHHHHCHSWIFFSSNVSNGWNDPLLWTREEEGRTEEYFDSFAEELHGHRFAREKSVCNRHPLHCTTIVLHKFKFAKRETRYPIEWFPECVRRAYGYG